MTDEKMDTDLRIALGLIGSGILVTLSIAGLAVVFPERFRGAIDVIAYVLIIGGVAAIAVVGVTALWSGITGR